VEEVKVAPKKKTSNLKASPFKREADTIFGYNKSLPKWKEEKENERCYLTKRELAELDGGLLGGNEKCEKEPLNVADQKRSAGDVRRIVTSAMFFHSGKIQSFWGINGADRFPLP